MEITLEVSQDKWPSTQVLQGLWKENLPALVSVPPVAVFAGLRWDTFTV